MENKKYTWKEIKEFLENELNKTNHILTFGFIGSCNIDHDIDTIITKKSDSKASDFYREVHRIFARLNYYLRKNYNSKVIRTSDFCDQEEVKFIANYKKGDLIFQVLSYVSFNQIKKHWNGYLSEKDSVENLIKNYYKCIFGNTKLLFEEGFLKNNKNFDNLILFLNDSDRINSSYSEAFLVKKMNVLFKYILKKRLGIETKIAKTKEDVRKIFYEVCDEIERRC